MSLNPAENEFDDIRPYRDHEVPEVLARLLSNTTLIKALRGAKWPKLHPSLHPVGDWAIKVVLKLLLRGISTTAVFQRKFIADRVLDRLLRDTSDGLTYSGLEGLDRERAYLYVSNHRDIVLDVAFLNYIMIREGFDTTEIAIGDNLLANQLVEDLMKINRSFTVKRNLSPRDQLKASMILSRYINTTMQDGNSVWIAQREGRTKDGNDETNPAVIKMVQMSQRRSGESFSEYINRIGIVPVAISYEVDPLDNLKAWEIHRNASKQEGHVKRKHEDLVSMAFGIKGYKGKIHYSFGEPLKGDFESERDVAEKIDLFVKKNYHIWPTNYIAYDYVKGENRFLQYYTEERRNWFLKRFKYLPEAVRNIAIAAYAHPIIRSIEGGLTVASGG